MPRSEILSQMDHGLLVLLIMTWQLNFEVVLQEFNSLVLMLFPGIILRSSKPPFPIWSSLQVQVQPPLWISAIWYPLAITKCSIALWLKHMKLIHNEA